MLLVCLIVCRECLTIPDDRVGGLQIIVDDSIEKCVNNPPFSLLIPRPFYITEACTVWSATTDTVPATANAPSSETMQATQQTVYLSTDAIADAAANDCELRDDGALIAYLRAMGQHSGSVEDFVMKHGAYDASPGALPAPLHIPTSAR